MSNKMDFIWNILSIIIICILIYLYFYYDPTVEGMTTDCTYSANNPKPPNSYDTVGAAFYDANGNKCTPKSNLTNVWGGSQNNQVWVFDYSIPFGQYFFDNWTYPYFVKECSMAKGVTTTPINGWVSNGWKPPGWDLINWGYAPVKGSNDEYNEDSRGDINDCFHLDRVQVNDMCSAAELNLKQYAINIKSDPNALYKQIYNTRQVSQVSVPYYDAYGNTNPNLGHELWSWTYNNYSPYTNSDGTQYTNATGVQMNTTNMRSNNGYISNDSYPSNYPGNGWDTGAWDQQHFHIWDMAPNLHKSYSNCNTANQTILTESHNYCPELGAPSLNPNTLLDANGVNTCKVAGTSDTIAALYAKQQQYAQAAATAATNAGDTATLAIINSPAHLGYKLPSASNPFSQRFKLPSASNPFSQTYNTIVSTLNSSLKYCTDVYNNCNNSGTFMDSNGLTMCMGKPVSDAYNLCNNAIFATGPDQANDPSGQEILTKKWSDVSNNLTGYGNTIASNTQKLNNVQAYCQLQLDMYNQWKVDEDAAKNAPCVPEYPIIAPWGPQLTDIVEKWSNNANATLEGLLKRLEIIQNYTSNYPKPNAKSDNSSSILQLDPSNVTFTPHSGILSTPVFTVTSSPIDISTGISPIQYLNISLPNGPPGDSGIAGPPGGQGRPGPPGISGSVGSPGVYEIPQQYYNVM